MEVSSTELWRVHHIYVAFILFDFVSLPVEMVGTLIKNKNKIPKPEDDEMARIRIECAENGKNC